MIKATSAYFSQIPPVFIDGITFVLIQGLTFLQAAFGSDQAAKYIDPFLLWIIQVSIGELASVFLAIKMFRSSSYADHLKDKKIKQEGDTKSWSKQPTGA